MSQRRIAVAKKKKVGSIRPGTTSKSRAAVSPATPISPEFAAELQQSAADARAKATESKRVPGSFTSLEYATALGIGNSTALAQLTVLLREGKLKRVQVPTRVGGVMSMRPGFVKVDA